MLTDDQIKERQKCIGSSDVGVILGASDFKSPYELWLEKTGQIELEDLDRNEAIMVGNYQEEGVIRYAEDDQGDKFARDVLYAVTDIDAPVFVRCDAVNSETEPVEAKTAGILNPFHDFDEWGEEGSDEVPLRYFAQVHIQMMGCKSQFGYLYGLLAGRGHVRYEFTANTEVRDMIKKKCEEFWDHVEREVPYMEQQLPLDAAKRIRREVGKEINIAKGSQVLRHIDAFETYKESLKLQRDRCDVAQAQIVQALGDAEIAILPDGRKVTFKETKRKGYTVEPTSYRTLRINKPRKQK